MIFTLDDVLDTGDLAYLRGLYDSLGAQPGAETAEGPLKQVKNNRQLVLGERAPEIRARVLDALNRSDFLSFALMPKTVSLPLLNAYGPGDGYGAHTDAHLGFMGGRYFRCDVSCTLFIDDPSAYDGGELSIDGDAGPQTFKLAAGAGVFYPTYYVHRVNPVTRGERRGCVLWFESFVREAEKRRLLLELQQVRAFIEARESPDSQVRHHVVNVCENLQRMWVEP